MLSSVNTVSIVLQSQRLSTAIIANPSRTIHQDTPSYALSHAFPVIPNPSLTAANPLLKQEFLFSSNQLPDDFSYHTHRFSTNVDSHLSQKWPTSPSPLQRPPTAADLAMDRARNPMASVLWSILQDTRFGSAASARCRTLRHLLLRDAAFVDITNVVIAHRIIEFHRVCRARGTRRKPR